MLHQKILAVVRKDGPADVGTGGGAYLVRIPSLGAEKTGDSKDSRKSIAIQERTSLVAEPDRAVDDRGLS